MRVIAAAVVVLLVATGCSDIVETERVDGNGTIVTVTRDVGSFDELELGGEGDVFIEEGEAWTLSIEADENLLDYIETNVSSDRLLISTKRGYDIEPTQAPAYRVTSPAITVLRLSGAGSIDLPRSESADPFSITLTGVGDITVGVLTPTGMDVTLSGVGDITIGGVTETQDIELTGVGTYDAADLQSEAATVLSTGTADAVVWVTLGARHRAHRSR